MVNVITSGQNYTDIDAFAAAIAYGYLLDKKAQSVKTVLPGKLNHSVTKSVRAWGFEFQKVLRSTDDIEFIVVDVSDPEHFADFVDVNKVIEIYDHHQGFSDYWKEKIGDKAKIDLIGAAATLIWEEYEKADIKPSTTIANLLYTAIISNTLNLNASVTNNRDKEAVSELTKSISLPKNWIEEYFTEQEKEVMKDPIESIVNDTKKPPSNAKNYIVIGQIELWESRSFIERYQSEIKKALQQFGLEAWFLTAPSIRDGINYIYTTNSTVKELLKNKINADFTGDVGTTNKLWLRKEIVAVIEGY